jgi:hypothetical protein
MLRGFIAIVVAATSACAGAATGPSRARTGLWGGERVLLSVAADGTHLEFDCAHGELPAASTLDHDSRFDAAGVYVREHGGPIRQSEMPDSHPANYSGLVTSQTLTLTIRLSDSSETIGTFTLVPGSSGRVFKCL